MTAKDTNTDRITRVEVTTQAMSDDIKDMKNDIKEIKDFMYRLDSNLEKKFFTRLEGRVLQSAIGLVISVVTFWYLVKDHMK